MQIVDGKPYIQQIKELIIEYTKRLVCDLILITNKTINKKIHRSRGRASRGCGRRRCPWNDSLSQTFRHTLRNDAAVCKALMPWHEAWRKAY